MQRPFTPMVTTPEIPPTQRKLLKAGEILCGFAVALSIISMILVLATIIVPLLYAFLLILVLVVIIVIVVVTLGLVFAIEDNIVIKLWDFIQNSNSDSITAFASTCFGIAPYVSIASLVLSILSLVFLFGSKQKCSGHKASAIVFGILSIIGIALYFFFLRDAVTF